jgi:hypothetical protein
VIIHARVREKLWQVTPHLASSLARPVAIYYKFMPFLPLSLFFLYTLLSIFEENF